MGKRCDKEFYVCCGALKGKWYSCGRFFMPEAVTRLRQRGQTANGRQMARFQVPGQDKSALPEAEIRGRRLEMNAVDVGIGQTSGPKRDSEIAFVCNTRG